VQAMKIIIFLFSFLALSVNAAISLEKPISVILSDSEVIEHELTIRKGDFDSDVFKNVLVFEGVLLDVKIKIDGENAYKFNVKRTLKFASDNKKFQSKYVDIVAPSKPENGGLKLKVGTLYRVCAPMLPDGRYAIWKGTIIELSGS
jgi:hypothetical protein